jgi:catecholate siderophore receptor
MPSKHLPSWAIAIFSAFLSAGAVANDSQNTSSEAMEEVTVRAQFLYADQVNALRSPTPILDVPQSLSIVSSEQIAARGFNSVGDIIDYLPGVSTTQGEGHRDAVVFRGVRSTADFFIDGMRDDVQYYRPLYNLEQVEVLRGPNALLFGRGGTGGVLNRVTKKGQLGSSFSEVQASTDSFGEVAGQFDTNVPLSDSVALRVNAMIERLDNHRDYFDGERLGINPSLKVQLDERTTIDLSYEYVDHERFIDRGIPTGADGRPVSAFQDIVFGDPDINSNELTANLWRASVQRDFSDTLKVNASLFHGDYDKLYQNFYASSYDEQATPKEVTLDGYVDTTQRRNTIFSLNLIKEFSMGDYSHLLIGGVETIDTQSNQDRWNAFWSASQDDTEVFAIADALSIRGGVGVNVAGVESVNDFSRDLNDDTRVSVKVTSAYIQDEISVNQYFDVVMGARFDSFDITVDNIASSEQRSRKDERISPRFGLVAKPLENISVYASYSESFLPRSGEQFANINGTKNQLEPDTFTNREVGIKWDLASGLSVTAALFEVEQSSPQVADDNPETLDVIDSTIDGFELQLSGSVTDRWTVSAGYSRLDGEQVDRSGPTGKTPRELPETMYSLWNRFDINSRLSLGLGLTHQDDSFINNSNTAILPAYTRVDAAAYYTVSPDLSLQLNVENVTDELYFPNAHSTHQATVGAPLNVRLAFIKAF